MSDTTFQRVQRLLSARKRTSLEAPGATLAAVLLLLYQREGGLWVLLGRRTQELEHHKGEVSFPGGAKDPEEQDLWQTALREAHEEMGIHPADVTLLGELDDVYTRISGFVIHPFVATIPYPYPFRANPREVAEVLEVPLSQLRRRTNQREEVRWVAGEPLRRYAYAYRKRLIYGATARIIQQLLELLDTRP
ncbi:MAG: NUDIX hydrolase [Dehalococcoidia bacterium]